jgi:PAS domain-containing protein
MAYGLVDVRILQREYLLAISRAITAELDLQDVLRIILRAGVELVAGKAGMIALYHPELDSVRVAAVHGIPAALVDHFAPLLRDILPLDAAEQEAELTRRLQTIARRSNLGFTQMVRLPMISGGETIGLIYVFLSGTPYHLPNEAASLLRSFAEQAAIAVRNARLYQQVNQEKQRLDAIQEQSADGVLILDRSLRIKVFNRALSAMTGWPAGEAIGQEHQAVIHWEKLRTDTDLPTGHRQWLAAARRSPSVRGRGFPAATPRPGTGGRRPFDQPGHHLRAAAGQQRPDDRHHRQRARPDPLPRRGAAAKDVHLGDQP